MSREEALKQISEAIERARSISPLSGQAEIFNQLVSLYELVQNHVPEGAGFDFYVRQAEDYAPINTPGEGR